MTAWLVACPPDGLCQAISWTDPHIPWRSAGSRDVCLLLPPDALRDCGPVQADGGHAAAFRPELPVPELVLEVRMTAGHEVFSFNKK
jgi:hypothetical protein